MMVALTVGMGLMLAQAANATASAASGLLAQCEKFPGEAAALPVIHRLFMGKANERETTEAFAYLSCRTYMQGFVDALQADWARRMVESGEQATGVCMPDGATYEQSIRIVVKYMQDNPKHLHQPRHIVAFMALYEAFPCKTAQGVVPRP